MHIIFFGTGGAGGSVQRARMCIGFFTSDANLLVDVGEGCWRTMDMINYSIKDFDYIYVSHLHPDHYVGLFELCVRSMDVDKLRILVPSDIALNTKYTLLDIVPRPVKDKIEFISVDREFVINKVKMRIVGVDHVVPCYGVVVEGDDGRVFYTSDTRFRFDILKSVESSDLIIHEATIPSGMHKEAEVSGHTSVDQVLRYSDETTSKLALVHLTIYSEKDLIKRLKEKRYRNVIVPSDGTVLTV